MERSTAEFYIRVTMSSHRKNVAHVLFQNVKRKVALQKWSNSILEPSLHPIPKPRCRTTPTQFNPIGEPLSYSHPFSPPSFIVRQQHTTIPFQVPDPIERPPGGESPV